MCAQPSLLEAFSLQNRSNFCVFRRTGAKLRRERSASRRARGLHLLNCGGLGCEEAGITVSTYCRLDMETYHPSPEFLALWCLIQLDVIDK